MSQTSILKFNTNSIDGVSMGADIVGLGLDVAEATLVSVQSVWTGTSPVGSLLIKASNDDIIYTTLTTTAVSGNSGSLMFKDNVAGYRYIRAEYTYTSGTGTLTSKVCAKG